MNCQFNLLWIVFEIYFYEAFLTVPEITVRHLYRLCLYLIYSSTRSFAGKCSFSSVVFIWFLVLEVKFIVVRGVAKSFVLT